MQPMTIDGCTESDPGKYMLPIRMASPTASLPPVCVEWWQWFPASSPSELPMWRRVTAYGTRDKEAVLKELGLE